MPTPEEFPTNPESVAARREHDTLMAEAVIAYESYLISRSRGVRSAVEPAHVVWMRAHHKYLLTCHPSEWAAPGDAENPGAAPEVPRGWHWASVKEDLRMVQLVDQVGLIRGDVVRNTQLLRDLLKAMTFARAEEERILKGTGGGVPVGIMPDGPAREAPGEAEPQG